MLTSIVRALCDHLAQTGLPVYLADCVPSSAAFPYITAEPKAPLAPHASGQLALTLWCAGDTAHTQRLAQADLLLKQLPARGLHLTTDDGVIVLRQEGGATFLRESAAQGVKTVWSVRFYPDA